MNTHVIDRDGHVWALVRDGGMVTRATDTGPISAGIRWLEVTAGPLVEFDPAAEYQRLLGDGGAEADCKWHASRCSELNALCLLDCATLAPQAER